MYRNYYSMLLMQREKYQRENRTHGLVDGVNGNLNKAAFTLIELLVVIAIISLLVSILLPSLKTAKELARRAVCISNEHGIGMVVNLFAADNDGKLPQNTYDTATGAYCPIQKYLYDNEYIDSFDQFYCPSNRRYKEAYWWSYTPRDSFDSYSANQEFFCKLNDNYSMSYVTSFEDACQTAMILDGANIWFYGYVGNPFADPFFSLYVPRPRHVKESYNFGYLDGSVVSIYHADLIAEPNPTSVYFALDNVK